MLIFGPACVETKALTRVSSLPLNIQHLPIRQNNKALWVYGYVEYADVFGDLHTHRFYFRTVAVGERGSFQSFDYKHYNQST